jgi:Txe/YoeB family toxin of Txe-Axe toxin-antitoxin module
MARRQERMNKTANKKVREDAKKACNDVQDLVKNLQSSPYKITEQK